MTILSNYLSLKDPGQILLGLLALYKRIEKHEAVEVPENTTTLALRYKRDENI